MKAAIVYGHGDLRVEDIPIPEVPANSILVKVMACGLCGTDRRIYRKGDHRAAYPVVVGHEIAGVVEKVAPGVKGVKEGDRVCVAPGHGCGQCPPCKKGYPNVCATPFPSLGYKVNGGFAEYIAVPENIFRLGFVNPIPEGLSFDQASMSEIIACCINAQNNATVEKGDVVLIIGSGPAGMIHAQLSRIAGAKKVILTQRSRHRLEMAKERFDVDRIIASSEENLTEAVMQETNGIGADVVFVCAPSGAAQETAMQLAAPRGRVNLFGGLAPQEKMISVDANNLHYREFFLSGASSSLPEGNRKALELLASRQIDPDVLITHRFGLDQIHDAFDAMDSGMAIKVVVNP